MTCGCGAVQTQPAWFMERLLNHTRAQGQQKEGVKETSKGNEQRTEREEWVQEKED